MKERKQATSAENKNQTETTQETKDKEKETNIIKQQNTELREKLETKEHTIINIMAENKILKGKITGLTKRNKEKDKEQDMSLEIQRNDMLTRELGIRNHKIQEMRDVQIFH